MITLRTVERQIPAITLAVVTAFLSTESALALTQSQEISLLSRPGWVIPGATIQLNFYSGQYWSQGSLGPLVVTRTGPSTDLLPTSPSGFAYQSFSTNAPRITGGLGLLREETRENYLNNSVGSACVTQTTGSMPTGTYSLWENGPATLTPVPVTAVGTGFSAASQGSPSSFVVTVAGTVQIAVSGGVPNACQLEGDPGTISYPTSFIPTTGSPATRGVENVSMTVQGNLKSILVVGTPNSPAAYTNGSYAAFLTNPGESAYLFLARSSVAGQPIGQAGASSASPSGTWAQNTQGKLSVFLDNGNTVRVVFNNGTQAATASSLQSPLSVLGIGGEPIFGTLQFNGYIKYLAASPQSLLPY